MGIKVNVTEQEASAGDRTPFPIGKFPTFITDVTQDSPRQGENIGKPMLLFVFTVQEDVAATVSLPDPRPGSTKLISKTTLEYANRKIFVNACCWSPALYTIVQILKAMGKYQDCLDNEGNLDIPEDPEFYLGTPMWVRMAVNKKSKENNPENPDYWIQAQGFSPFTAESGGLVTASSAPADASLLP